MEKKLMDILGKDLTGYQLMTVFWLEPMHGLAGFYPILAMPIDDDEYQVVATSKDLLQKVEEMLPTLDYEIVTRETLALVNMKDSECVSVEGITAEGMAEHKENGFAKILTEEHFEKLKLLHEKPFIWFDSRKEPLI